jgi:hypothetical protein
VSPHEARFPERGDRVVHPRFGPGTVDAKQALARARVCFDHEPTLPRTVRRNELTLEAAPTQAPAARAQREPTTQSTTPRAQEPATPAPLPTPASLDRDHAWQMLEALRLGIVPAHGVQDYTVAREAEFGSLAALFQAGRGCRVVWGDYGAGKTHLLDAAEQMAQADGLATARITLDPRENALHHPLRLYKRIAASIRMPRRTGTGIELMVESLIDSRDHLTPSGRRASRFLSPFLHALVHGDEEEIGWLRDYVHGDNVASEEVNAVLGRLGWGGERVLRLSDYRTYGRMFVHLVGTLACWSADAGARGLVLLFDEVERVQALSGENRRYALEVLRHYAAVTMQRDHLAFDPETLYKGGHAVHRDLPLRFRDDQPLAVVFALTPLEEIEQQFASITASSDYGIRLPPLGAGYVSELVRRLAGVYVRAHASFAPTSAALASIEGDVAERLAEGEGSFREAVRATVFLLDTLRLQPSLG